MNSKVVLNTVVGLVIGVILLASLLVPAIDSASHAGATHVTNGTTFMHELDEETTMILTPGSIVVGEQVIEGTSYAPIASDMFWVTMNATYMNIFWYDGSTHYGGIAGANVTLNPADKSISITDITPSAGSTITDTSLELTYNDFCFIRDVNGDYTCTTPTDISNLMVNSVNDVYAVGAYSGVYSVSDNIAKINGVAQEGDAFTVTTTSDQDLVKIAINTSLQLAYLFVPASVWGESAVSNDALQLLYVIPVMIICALLIGVVSIMISRRD